MKPTQAFGTVALVFAVAIASTITGMVVSRRADHISNLEKQIKSDESRIQILKTELAYLSSPQRVQALVDLHRPDLKTPNSGQYVLSVSDVVPQQPGAPATQLAVVQTAVRQQAERIMAISLPRTAPPPAAPAAPAAQATPELRESDTIGQLIATADSPMLRSPVHDGLSQNLAAVVQSAAIQDTNAR